MNSAYWLLPATLLALACPAFAEDTALNPVVVTGTKINESTDAALGASSIGNREIAPKRASTSDTARLLDDIPGVSLYGAGGISSLPVIHGLADERLNVQVNGMGLMPACPNHMNSPLSYIDPTSVDSIKVYAGVTPVSVGGDSIGGTILVNSAPPKFAGPGEGLLFSGDLGVFYRSNNNGRGGNILATIATESVNLTYTGSSVESDNYHAADAFHRGGPGKMGGRALSADEVGSSAYEGRNHDIGIALRLENHLLQLNVGEQRVPYEGFPNQRMDLTENKSTTYNLAYTGRFDWGDLEARIYKQDITHAMNMGPDRMLDIFPGMPMNTDGKVKGSKLQANILYSERDTFRIGAEGQYYVLYDWWPAIAGQMGPNSFWNIDDGTRNKLALFAEWEATWSPQWVTLLGIRPEQVRTDAGPVHGFSFDPIYSMDAATFNGRSRERTFRNLDLTALVHYEPSPLQSYDLGYARKSRAPSLYQLYPWSTYEMVTTMNNFAGDGGGYVGNPDLKAEVAHTISASADWHDADKERWGLKAAAYFTHIADYISARRCTISYCDPTKATATTGFVVLQQVNQTAEITGLDLSGQLLLGEAEGWGRFTGTGIMSYLRGKETSTGDNLFNMMPLNAKLAVNQRLGIWNNTIEAQFVAAKTHVSQVRNEVPTPGYGLLNLRSSVQVTKTTQLHLAIENVLDRYYASPLGGAYVGQGNVMYLSSVNWGTYVPGMGRSINLSLSMHY